MEHEAWRCYFETADGTVLRSQEAFDSVEEANLYGEQVLEHPDAHELCDPDGYPVAAAILDPDAEFTVEPVDPDTLD